MWNKDELTGKKKQITGTINEKVGEFIHDPQLEAEGEAEQLEGQAQQKIGKLRRKTGETIRQAGKVIAGSGITSLLALTLLGGSLARTKAVELAKSAHAGLIVTTKIDVKPGKITRHCQVAG